MSPNLRQASERLSTWVDDVRGRLSHVACCDDLTAALVSFMRHAAKVARAVSLPGDDSSEEQRQQLSKELLTVLYEICAHLHLRSRDFLASSGCWGQFEYWEHQCAILSYVLDVGIICNSLKQALSRVCYILLKNRHLVWDVLVRTRAISTSREALGVYQKLVAWCPRSCASAELYFKFVVCAVCLARQERPGSGWHAVKCAVLSIEPAAFDFREWFIARPSLVALLPASSQPKSGPKLIAALCNNYALDVTELLRACRAMTVSRGAGSCIRSACDAAADEQDMFSFVNDDRVAREPEDAAAAPKVEDNQLRGILDSTLRRIPSAIVSPHATDTEPNSELISEAGSSLRITDSFLRAFLGSPSPERASLVGKKGQECGRRTEFVQPPPPQPAKRFKRESTSGEDPGGSKGGKTASRAASEDETPALEKDADPSQGADSTSLQRERSNGRKSGAHSKVTADSSQCASVNCTVQKSDLKVQKNGDQTGTTSDTSKRPAQGSARRTPTSTPELAEGAPRKRHQDDDARTAPTHGGRASVTATTLKTCDLRTKETPRRQELGNCKRPSSDHGSGSEDSLEVVSVVRTKGAALSRISNGADRRSASKNATRLAITSSSEAESGTETEEAASPRRRKSRATRKLSSTSDDSSGLEDESEDESEDKSEEGATETASRLHRKPCRLVQQSSSEDTNSAEEVSKELPVHHQEPSSDKHPSIRRGVQSKDGSEAESAKGSERDTSPQSHKSSISPKLQGGSDSESEESGPVKQRRSVRMRKPKPCITSDSSEQESCDEQVVEATVGGQTSHDAKQPEVGSSPGGSDPGGKPLRSSQSPSVAKNTGESTTSTGRAAGAKLTQQTDSYDSSATNDSSESESYGETVIHKKNGKPSTLGQQEKLEAFSNSGGKSRSEISQSRRASRSSVEVRPSRTRKVHPNRIVDSSEEDLWEYEAVRANNEKPALSSESADEIPCGQRSPGCSQQQGSQGRSLVPTTEPSQTSTPSNIKTSKGESVCTDESEELSNYESSDSEATEKMAKLPVLQQRQKITASSVSSVELDGKASNRHRAPCTSRQQEAKSFPSRPCGKEGSDSPENKLSARKLCRKNQASSQRQECNEIAGSSGPKGQLTHNVLNGQRDASSAPRKSAASAVTDSKPARDPKPKQKSVIHDVKLNASNSGSSQSDRLALESGADTVDLSADDESPLGQRQRASSLFQASTLMASPERRSLSSQREMTPAVEWESHVLRPSGSDKRPSEEHPVFKLPQPLETPKSSTSALPSGSDDVGTSTGGTSSSPKMPSKGASSSVRKGLADGKQSAATDENDVSKSGSNEDIGSDGSTCSLSPDQSPLKPEQVAKAMPATGDATELASFSDQSICTGPPAVKRKWLEEMHDTQGVTSDVDARHTHRRSCQDYSQSAQGLKTESEVVGLREKQRPFSKPQSPPFSRPVKKKTAREKIVESSQSDSDDASTNRCGQRGPGRSSHLIKAVKSPEAGPVAGISNRSMQCEWNSEKASNGTDDEDVPNGCPGTSSSREQEDHNVDPKSHRSKQASAIRRPAAKSPRGRQRTVVEKNSVIKSDHESTGEDTAELETPNKRPCRMLSNSKMHSSSLKRNANESSSSADEEPLSKLASAMIRARKRQLARKADDSMPLGTPFTKAASQNANESSSTSDEEELPLSELASAMISARKRQLAGKAADSMPQGTPFSKAAGAVLNEKSTTKRGKELAASRMAASEREQTTQPEDSDSELSSTRSKSSRLRQMPVLKAEPVTKVKAGALPDKMQFLSSLDNRCTLTESDSNASQGKEVQRRSREDERSSAPIPSVELQCSTPRVQTSNENGLLQAEEVLNSSECISSALLPVPSSLDSVQASAACSSFMGPSTSRRLFVASVGRVHAMIPGCESATELGRHTTLTGASDEDPLTKLSQASDNLNGLTQKSFASSQEERSNLWSSACRRSLQKHHSPETIEQFVIDYNEGVPPSFSDTDDDNDPLFEVQRRVNVVISAADFDRSVSPLPSPPKTGKQTPQNTPPSNNTESEKSGPTRAGRLSLAAIRAKSSSSPAVTSNVANSVTVAPRHTRRDEEDGCQQRQERPEKSVCDQAEKKHDGIAVAAATGDTPNTPALRRSVRISGRVSGCAAARANRNSAEPTSVVQVIPPSGRSRSLGLLNEEAEPTPANETSQFRQAPHMVNVGAAVQKRRSGRDAYSTPELSSQSLNGDSSDASDADERVTPVKVVAERIEHMVVRAQPRCFTCSSCSRSFSETTPKMRDSETMTDESLFRQGDAPSPLPGPSKRRKESDDNSLSPAKSVSSGRRSSCAHRERSEPTGHTRRETSPRRERTVSSQSGAATVALSTVLRPRRLRQTVTAPRRLSYM